MPGVVGRDRVSHLVVDAVNTIRRSALTPGERLEVKGGMSTVDIAGDIQQNAQLIVTGGMNDVRVGYIDAGALLKVTGGMNTVVYQGKHATARVEDSGGMNNIIDLLGQKAPRSSRPGGVNVQTGGTVSNVKIRGTDVWINGKKITEPIQYEPHGKTKTVENGKVLTVQKSPRPREQWGT